jgi:hypothetical protein
MRKLSLSMRTVAMASIAILMSSNAQAEFTLLRSCAWGFVAYQEAKGSFENFFEKPETVTAKVQMAAAQEATTDKLPPSTFSDEFSAKVKAEEERLKAKRPNEVETSIAAYVRQLANDFRQSNKDSRYARLTRLMAWTGNVRSEVSSKTRRKVSSLDILLRRGKTEDAKDLVGPVFGKVLSETRNIRNYQARLDKVYKTRPTTRAQVMQRELLIWSLKKSIERNAYRLGKELRLYNAYRLHLRSILMTGEFQGAESSAQNSGQRPRPERSL